MGREFIDLFEGWAGTYDETVAGMDPQYAAVFSGYEDILQEVVDRTFGNVLEYGVGTGNLTKKLLQANHKVIGIEPSGSMLQAARTKLPNAHLEEGDFLSFPKSDMPIDSIVSTYAFHHLTDEEKEKAIKQFSAILPEKGKVIFADTVFETEKAKESAIAKAKQSNFPDLAADLQREYYTTVPVLDDIFTAHDFEVSWKQMNEFVWLIVAIKKGEGRMTEKMNVESFQLDHTKVKAPYVRLASVTQGDVGDMVYKYDIRFKQPNREHMEMPALHSIEHLMAEKIRNHMDEVLDIGPMGCQTGFYLTLLNHDDYGEVLHVLEKTLQDVLKAEEVPACNEVQCGWAASHSLEGAKNIARDMLNEKAEWHEVF